MFDIHIEYSLKTGEKFYVYIKYNMPVSLFSFKWGSALNYFLKIANLHIVFSIDHCIMSLFN